MTHLMLLFQTEAHNCKSTVRNHVNVLASPMRFLNHTLLRLVNPGTIKRTKFVVLSQHIWHILLWKTITIKYLKKSFFNKKLRQAFASAAHKVSITVHKHNKTDCTLKQLKEINAYILDISQNLSSPIQFQPKFDKLWHLYLCRILSEFDLKTYVMIQLQTLKDTSCPLGQNVTWCPCACSTCLTIQPTHSIALTRKREGRKKHILSLSTFKTKAFFLKIEG